MNQTKKSLLWVAVSIVIIVLALFMIMQNKKQTGMPGTPNPGVSNQPPAGWVATTTSVNGVIKTFYYPPNLGTTYLHLYDWPPMLAFEHAPYTCTEAGSVVDRAGQTKPETTNGRPYCVTRESDGAAGSIYTNYAYAFPYQNGQGIFTFTVQFPQCVNYDDPKRTECQAEESAFNISPTIDQIVQTLK